MKPKKRDRRSAPEAASRALPFDTWSVLAEPRSIVLGFVVATLCFYFVPLFSEKASIVWDAVDVQYSPQQYLSEMLHEGKLPTWTPYIFSGLPFLADPQVGAWYPLNWPILLLGVTPKAIEAELAVHALLAALGAWLLARDLLASRAGAVFAGVVFAFSGLFAETSSHVGPFQATSLLPWLLWAGRRAARSVRWLPVLAIVSGCLILIGHFQTALYSFFALAIWLAADLVLARVSLKRTGLAAAVAIAGGAVLSAVMVLPGLELTANSVRAGANFHENAAAALVPGALITLFNPNHYGAPGVEHYSGPPDITQFYFYMGIFCVPLALAGLATGLERWYALALIVPGIWYAFGPPAGLYSAITLLPGFRNVRAPIQMWFVAAMGLALLAGAGVSALRRRTKSTRLVVVLFALTAIDLYYWNMANNGLTYARQSYQVLYGDLQDRFQKAAAPLLQQPMYRIHHPSSHPAFGPLNGTLDTRMEVTFGYNPLELLRYSRYIAAAGKNPLLLNGLGVTAVIDSDGRFVHNPSALPRIYAPPSIASIANAGEAAARLENLNPANEGVVEGGAPIPDNRGVDVRITAYEGDTYRAHYISPHRALLRIAVPFFPGWRAEVDGQAAETLPVDYALTGVMVPAGTHDLVVHYRSTWLATGLAISVAGWFLALGWLGWAFKARTQASSSLENSRSQHASK